MKSKYKRLGYGLLVNGTLQSFSYTRAGAMDNLRAWKHSPFASKDDRVTVVELVEKP